MKLLRLIVFVQVSVSFQKVVMVQTLEERDELKRVRKEVKRLKKESAEIFQRFFS